MKTFIITKIIITKKDIRKRFTFSRVFLKSKV